LQESWRPANRQTGARVIFALILLATLAGCVPKNPFVRAKAEESPLLDFTRIYNTFNLAVQSVQRLDTDGDGLKEWVIFYRFDLPPTPETGRISPKERFAPIAGLVYDVSECRPPSILPYALDPGDAGYLGTDRVYAEVRDLLPKDNGTPEVIVSSQTNGLVTAVSIFRWFDLTQNPCRQRYSGQQGYRLLGTFRGDAGVEVSSDGKVTVKKMTDYTRSQLAYQYLYLPRNREGGQTYMDESGRKLAPPVRESITFAFGPPASPRDSPYPEKSVLAFYQDLGKNNEAARAYLAADADPSVTETNYGLGVPLDDLSYVVVSAVEYTPDIEREKNHESVEVTVRVRAVHKDNSTEPVREVRWLLEGVPIPERTDCEWRLSKVLSMK
jgi:hypothetical protein